MTIHLGLGWRLLERGESILAWERGRAALVRDPANDEALRLLAAVAGIGGDSRSAQRAHERAIAARPRHPLPRVACALALLEQGRTHQALVRLREALTLDPALGAALVALARALQAEGQGERARSFADRARRLDPDHPGALHALGRVTLDAGAPADALPWLTRARDLQPDSPDILADLSRALRAVGQDAQALDVARSALALRPDRADLHDVLACALLGAGQPDDADRELRKALARWPAHGTGWTNRAAVLIETRAPRDALLSASRALAVDPDDADARVNRAFALGLTGDYPASFHDYRHRWRTAAFRRLYRPAGTEPWEGQPLPGGTLLVRGEQGLGDQIMAARFLPALAGIAGRVVLECDPALHRLFAGLPGVDALITRGDPLPPADAWVGAMDLAGWAGTRADRMPVPVPYLKPPVPSPDLRAALPPRRRGWVGLVWAGKTSPRDRSCPLAPLAALVTRLGFAPVALVPGPRRADLARLPADSPVRDLTPVLGDMADTAAAVSLLDTVISVDTAVAHLTGALGVPGALLLLATPDWRWGERGARTVWYPSLRLVRQPEPGDWTSAFRALETLLEGPDGPLPRRA
ncbi:tetratricopeptide repeat protein [Pararhodospirillum oryzae]|uniref:Uncharacterized protein n=1 Tax=Pararhodospirillum oryzae TaxID=478448 RepID=A0A512H6B5_9PROT|nr:tetratricopeptide repeat protein [Pararhodospirillum oryzae]GEO81006.1 hypothetical protein ROR02_11370 [Pararhodospirillum oryzae]